jgi:DNA recombination protein Rad52
MAFTEAQIRSLSSKLHRKYVKTRELGDKTVSYIEGWHAIAEANRVFGFDGWDREMIWSHCVWEDGRRDTKACAYAVRVRIRVRADDVTIFRDGSGVGHGTGPTLGEAHESALKEAETDAMKRALVTFGNVFGLALYDKDQAGVRGRSLERGTLANLPSWTVLSADGHAIANCTDPRTFCTRLRQAINACSDVNFLRALWNQNMAVVLALRDYRPDLVTQRGVHYGALLERVFEQQLNRLTGQNSAEPDAPEIDKSVLTLAAPKRVRDDQHLAFVATLPCLICGRAPSQAHHLRFIQPRALGRKASDEWVVPLCNLHHRSLHDGGNEEAWWMQHRIDAAAEAARLWREQHTSGGSAVTSDPGPTETAPASSVQESIPPTSNSAADGC